MDLSVIVNERWVSYQRSPTRFRKPKCVGRRTKHLLLCSATNTIRVFDRLAMPPFKPGDLVVLKSGGPSMTVDAVNTDIFDDDKITGIVCAWFVGEKLERVRFDHRAIDHAQNSKSAEEPFLDATGEYKAVLDEMADAMNHLAEETHSLSRVGIKRQKPARVPKNGNTLRAANDKL